jgi:hypothetical protein
VLVKSYLYTLVLILVSVLTLKLTRYEWRWPTRPQSTGEVEVFFEARTCGLVVESKSGDSL